jgi:DNA-binding HxlR family transcriptional regulator
MIALALAPGRMRLSQLHRRLPGVSTGVLERYLQQMVALGLVRRTRFKEMPPRVELELTEVGRELLPVAGALTRWGMRHQWSPPSEREQVDVWALLRLLPALLEEHAGLPEGAVEAYVADADPPLCCYRVRDGRLHIDERARAAAERPHDPGLGPDAPVGPDAPDGPSPAAGELATARLHGDGEAWVAALGPLGDYGRLRITGDRRLATQILDALHRRL